MRSSVTPTASKLEGGAKRAHKTVFFDTGRMYVVVGKHSHSLSSIYREFELRNEGQRYSYRQSVRRRSQTGA